MADPGLNLRAKKPGGTFSRLLDIGDHCQQLFRMFGSEHKGTAGIGCDDVRRLAALPDDTVYARRPVGIPPLAQHVYLVKKQDQGAERVYARGRVGRMRGFSEIFNDHVGAGDVAPADDVFV
ncbi:hypothetical protein SDC9_110816 [bioreactor metagenome]|uniref:Uncharacterized protein n=1 Tax=bioreactor metagenome TaxID=1076179 RepID=A0A645BHA1_9ZZZZ